MLDTTSPPTAPPAPLLDNGDVAKMLSISPKSLENWRAAGKGPPWIRIGARAVRYDARAVHDWLTSRTVGGC